ncbi:MAG: hypothetical protein WAM78_21645 [Candidatus Sulfotelmatobacter sp.]
MNRSPSTENLIAEFTNALTCITAIDTLVPAINATSVDSTAKKLVQRMAELEQERWRIDREINSLRTALSVAGIKPGRFKCGVGFHETNYVSKKPFADMTLTQCCERILKDHRTDWLSKAEIEYLIVRGGYKFNTQASRGSVGITLQRMAREGLCDAQRTRGNSGNRYRRPQDVPQKGDNAASTNDGRK